MVDFLHFLKNTSYPGRGILVGKERVYYFIMGRSENSRNRVFVKTDDGIRTEAFDPAKLADPSLIIYHPVRTMGSDLVVTNGDQTDTICEHGDFRRGLMTREYEPDEPNWTPRISAIVHEDGSFEMSILKHNNGRCLREFFCYEGCDADKAYFISTYQGDGSPLPTFAGEPKEVELPEPEALDGGEAGGGKSDALVIEALRQVHIPHYRGLILRKTYPQLSDLVDKSMAYYKRAFPTAQYNATSHVWVFPSGAKIYFGSMQYTKDRTNYQGKAFDFIGFDELTHFEWEEYSYMMSRNRPTGPGTRVYLRATTNPGGVGHGWVKARFITPAPPGTPIVEQFPVRMPDGTEKVLERARVFIPSSVFDNPALLENDPDYLASLASLPEAEKQALLYGSWDSFSGQVFTEWRNDPGHYQDQRWTHVIAPFAIPRHWKIYRGYDFGFSKPFSVGWYAADEEGRLYRIKELYGCTGRPNEGLRSDPVEQARRIREAEQNDPMLKGRTILGVADPAIFDESRGESIAAMMERGPHFLHWVPGDHTRLAGKMQFHYRLAFDGEGRPMFQVFSTCRHFIRTLPNLVYDESNVEDIDTRQEDHIYDECRYVLMENPISPPRQTVQPPVGDDPLELHRRARFYRV